MARSCIKVKLNRNDSMLKVNMLKAYKHIKTAQNFISVQPRIIKKSSKWSPMQISKLIFIKYDLLLKRIFTHTIVKSIKTSDGNDLC